MEKILLYNKKKEPDSFHNDSGSTPSSTYKFFLTKNEKNHQYYLF